MENPIVVVDVETTGLWRSDRILEIACVTVDLQQGIIDEWATLVNPMRDVGGESRAIHGLSASDLSDSPTFPEIAGSVAAHLSGRVIVGHNVAFDLRMLELEYQRLGVTWPPLPAMCTMAWATTLGVRSRSLTACCAASGIEVDDAHCALADARATAALLLSLIERSTAILTEWEELSRRPVEISTDDLGATPHTRQRPTLQTQRSATYLMQLVGRLPAHPELSATQNCYLAVLDQALSDSILTRAEQVELSAVAADLGLDEPRVVEANRVYLGDLIRSALRDDEISESERAHLDAVGDALGLDTHAIGPIDRGLVNTRLEIKTGTRVCFTGDWDGVVEDEPWCRELAHKIAERARLVPIENVTKKCGLLVAADATSMSGKARKARQYGITVVGVEEFLTALEIGFARSASPE